MSNLLALCRHSNFFPLGIDVVVMEALRVKCNTALFAPVPSPALAVLAHTTDNGVAEDDEVANVVKPDDPLASTGQPGCC